MRYHVLGPLEVETDAGPGRPPRGRKQRLLLTALLRHAPRVVTVDHLVDLLWSGRKPADPTAALHTLVSRLRSFLREAGAGEPLQSEPYGYRLSVPRSEVDAQRFESLIAEAREAGAGDALARVENALALWRGQPFEEFCELPAFLAEATRLRELRAAAFEQRAGLLLQLGKTTEAIAAAESLVTEDPLREKPRALLMEALYRGGRQGDALTVFQSYRKRLSEELGLDPSPALRRLELEILRHERPDEPSDRIAHERSAETRSPGGSGEGRTVLSPEGPPAPVLRLAHVVLPAGGRLAWAEAGEGPPVVTLPAWVSSLAAIGAGTDPRSAFLARLAEHVRLIVYDRFGMGLSAGPVDDLSVDKDVGELLAVMDGAGIARATLLAMSQAGPPALAFAARHADRVAALILVGTYGSGPRTYPDAKLREAMLGLVRSHWGIGSKALTDLIVPDASAEEAVDFARVQLQAATPALAARALESFYAADVTDLLASVRCPALVLHYTHDRAVPFRGGQELATLLPNARLVALDALAHLPRRADLDRITRLVVDFVKGNAPAMDARKA